MLFEVLHMPFIIRFYCKHILCRQLIPSLAYSLGHIHEMETPRHHICHKVVSNCQLLTQQTDYIWVGELLHELSLLHKLSHYFRVSAR